MIPVTSLYLWNQLCCFIVLDLVFMHRKRLHHRSREGSVDCRTQNRSHGRGSIKKAVLKMFCNIYRKKSVLESHLIKFINLYKKKSSRRMFSWEYFETLCWKTSANGCFCVIFCFIYYNFSNSYKIITSCSTFVTT